MMTASDHVPKNSAFAPASESKSELVSTSAGASASASALTLADVHAAAQHIAPHIRRTPMVYPMGARELPVAAERLGLKLENLQVIGAFEARGALNCLLGLGRDAV